MDLKSLESKILTFGIETSSTRELIGERVVVSNGGYDEIAKSYAADGNIVLKLLYCSIAKKVTKAGPFLTHHYFDMFKQLSGICNYIKGSMNDQPEVLESRQFIIKFEPKHCFQSMQFLLRGDTVYIISNMRSCNFKKNLLYDVLLSALCANMVKQIVQAKGICVIMNIGSLHIFKEDI